MCVRVFTFVLKVGGKALCVDSRTSNLDKYVQQDHHLHSFVTLYQGTQNGDVHDVVSGEIPLTHEMVTADWVKEVQNKCSSFIRQLVLNATTFHHSSSSGIT